jgi:hypothetical protein
MKVGVTGTREGATKYQLREMRLLLGALKGTEFHHGDCNGVDVQAAAIARELGYKIVCYPPKSTEEQGYFGGDIVHAPAGYLERDRAIVDACDVLVVLPLQMEWQPKGGTWYTHDYAVKTKKPFTIIFPKDPNED